MQGLCWWVIELFWDNLWYLGLVVWSYLWRFLRTFFPLPGPRTAWMRTTSDGIPHLWYFSPPVLSLFFILSIFLSQNSPLRSFWLVGIETLVVTPPISPKAISYPHSLILPPFRPLCFDPKSLSPGPRCLEWFGSIRIKRNLALVWVLEKEMLADWTKRAGSCFTNPGQKTHQKWDKNAPKLRQKRAKIRTKPAPKLKCSE